MIRQKICAAVALFALSCSDSTPSPILIGTVETNGDPVGSSILALREVNAADGIDGRLVEMAGIDYGTDPTILPDVIQGLLDRDIVALVGPPTSSGTLLVDDLLRAAGVPAVATGATSPALTGSDPPLDYVFRVAPSDVFQARLLAGRALDSWGCTKTALVAQTDVYGATLGDALAQFFTGRGVPLVAREDIDPNGNDYRAALSRIESKTPDCILLVAFDGPGARVVLQWNEVPARAGTVSWGGTDSVYSTVFVAGVLDPSLIDGMRGTQVAPTPNTAEYLVFQGRYQSQFGADPEGYDARRYDATALILLGLARSHGEKGDALRESLYEVSRPPGTAIYPGDLALGVSILENGGDVDYVGASGPVDFDDDGDVLADYAIWQFDAATMSFVDIEYVPVAEIPPAP